MPRIALIHATSLAIAPVNDAFARLWPQAIRMNLLDDTLSVDHAKNQGALTQAMRQRFIDLAMYAKHADCDAILFTCSAFGPAIDGAANATGMLCMKPNQAMFEQAIALCRDKACDAALLATFEPSLAPMAQEFEQLSANGTYRPALSTHFVPEAMQSLAQGDAKAHHTLVAESAAQLHNKQVVMLAQFSMAAAMQTVQDALGAHSIVLTSPECAVKAMQSQLGNQPL